MDVGSGVTFGLCANLKKSKGKAFNVTQIDEHDDEKSEKEVKGVNYLAFTASYDNDYKTIDSPYMLNNPENESDDEVNLQIACNNLFVECNKLNKQNRRNLKSLKEAKLEKERLVKYVDECLAI
jgi:hypothetical protein